MRRALLVLAIATVLLFGLAATAFAAPGATPIDVSASANSMVVFTIDRVAVNFGAQNPGSAITMPAQPVVVEVKSNKNWRLQQSVVDGVSPLSMGLSTKFLADYPGPNGLDNVAKGDYTSGSTNGVAYTDVFGINIPWDTTPAVPLAGTVTFTLTQL